jgi:hypothetical protein
VIWSDPITILRDIPFGPGLNIIWSPDPSDTSPSDSVDAASGPGHGAGKTLVCRFLRYCLGESSFASDSLRQKISAVFKEGRVGCEILVDGVAWAVVRSIGVFKYDVAIQGGTLEDALASEASPEGTSAFLEMLADRYLTSDVAAVIAASRIEAWLLTLALLTRDQECRFGKVTEWRAATSDSGSPARKLSVGAATDVIRALLGAITPRERELEAEIAGLGKRREDQFQSLRRNEWLLQRMTAAIRKTLNIETVALPEGALLGPFLRMAARERLAQIALVNDVGDFPSLEELEAKYEDARTNVVRVEAAIAQAKSDQVRAEQLAQLIASESPGLSATIADAEMPICPVCEVPIDRALADGCGLSHKLPDLPGLRQRREKHHCDFRDRMTEAREAEDRASRLQAQLGPAMSQRDAARAAWHKVRSLRDERTDAWYSAQRTRDDVAQIEQLIDDIADLESSISRADSQIEERKYAVRTEREQHAVVFVRLGAHFDPLVRRLVGRDARGEVSHDGNGLHLVVLDGGERSTPAIDSMAVLAFDVAMLRRSIEGATQLPAFLIHDSPREADLGLSIYHELFKLMVDLETESGAPQFQYIVTTTTRPPAWLIDDPRIRLTLYGSPAEGRLLMRDL